MGERPRILLDQVADAICRQPTDPPLRQHPTHKLAGTHACLTSGLGCTAPARRRDWQTPPNEKRQPPGALHVQNEPSSSPVGWTWVLGGPGHYSVQHPDLPVRHFLGIR